MESAEHITLVDSSVLLDVMTEDAVNFGSSYRALARAADDGVIVINPVIFAEVTSRLPGPDRIDELLSRAYVRREAIPYGASFIAGRAYYRPNRPRNRVPTPVYFIGAHALYCGYRLLTSDVILFRRCYPQIDFWGYPPLRSALTWPRFPYTP